MAVWIFNPGYESSAKQGLPNYTPPKNVDRFRTDCAPLLLSLAGPEDRVLVPHTLPEALWHPAFCATANGQPLAPWGWAPELSQYGPLPYSTDEMRYFACRKRSVELWKMIYRIGGDLFEKNAIPPRVQADSTDLPNPPFVLKDLYSSSGRGVTFVPTTKAKLPAGQRQRIVEPLLEIQEDIGIELERTTTGTLRYLGLSRMQNNKGRYAGNRLNDPTLPHPDMHTYIDLVLEVLGSYDLKHYHGLIGVDTAIYKGSDGQPHIWPLIEINIRPTMGHVALALEKKHEHARLFEIRYLAEAGALPQPSSSTPLYLTDPTAPHSGAHLLTPLLPDTQFVALLHF